jgi:ABC-type transport system substrate-binding protein
VVRAQSNKQLYLGLVTDKPPFDNKTLRQAMAWATPYDDIIDKVYFGHAPHADQTRSTAIVQEWRISWASAGRSSGGENVARRRLGGPTGTVVEPSLCVISKA